MDKNDILEIKMNWIDRISPSLNALWYGRWNSKFCELDRYLYDHELVIFTEGRCHVVIDGVDFICPSDSWIIIPPGKMHRSSSFDEGVFRYCIHFDWVPSDGRNQDGQLFTIPPQKPVKKYLKIKPDFIPDRIMTGSISGKPLLKGLLKTLEARWKTGSGSEKLTCRAVFLEILIRLFSSGGTAGSRVVGEKNNDMAYAVKYILDQLPPQDVSIQESLQKLGRSYAHLSRVFRKKFGVTPVEYLNAVRIENAKGMLLRKEINVSQAAYAVGFNDPAYFSRIFKKMTGVSPGKYK